MRKAIGVLMLGAAVVLTGCGKSDQKVYTDNKGNQVAVSNSGDHMTITGQNGEKVEFGSGASATAKLPAYLPLYPGATVTSSFTGSGKDGAGGVIVFHAQAAPAAIIAFYKDKTASAGMAQSMAAESGQTSTYIAANEKTKQTASISATASSDGSDVNLTWSNK
jgi:hypothetical protein